MDEERDGEEVGDVAADASAPALVTPSRKRKAKNLLLQTEIKQLQDKQKEEKKERTKTTTALKVIVRKRNRMLKKIEGLSTSELCTLARAKSAAEATALLQAPLPAAP